MKKLLTIAFTLLLGATLSFAQATGGSTDKPAEGGKKTTSTKSGKKAHKGGKEVQEELRRYHYTGAEITAGEVPGEAAEQAAFSSHWAAHGEGYIVVVDQDGQPPPDS